MITKLTHQKIYLQLYKIFKSKIGKEEWKINSKIPPEWELCEIFNTSKISIKGDGYKLKI